MRKYLAQNNLLIICQIFIALIFSAALSFLPLIIGSFIENASLLSDRDIVYYAVAFVGGVVLILLFDYLQKICYAKLYQRLMTSFKNDLFQKIYAMGYEDYYANDTEHYINLIIEDAKTLYASYFEVIIALIISLISMAVYTTVVFALNWIMALAILATALLSLLIPKLAGRQLSQKKLKKSNANKRYIGTLKDLFAGFSANNTNTYRQFAHEHKKSNEEAEKVTYAYGKYSSFVDIFSGASLYIMNIVVFVVGMLLVYYNRLSVGELVVLISFTDIMILPIRDIIYEIIELKSASGIKEKLQSVMDYVRPQNMLTIDSLDKSIELTDIRYEVEGFVLTVKKLIFIKGKKYAVIGKSGSGKSTLAKIVLGHIKNYSGSVMVDGIDTKYADLSNIVAEIAQKAYVFNCGAKDNITLFGSYDDKNLDNYVTRINAKNIMRENLGEYGKNISGGEANKISILRAMCKGCKALVCDEMFSGLDEVSKRDISSFLFSDGDLTVISVTHDISPENLSNYDGIVIMRDGGVSAVMDKSSIDHGLILDMLR